MCLSIPSQVIAINDVDGTATVDTLGVRRDISTHLLSEPIAIGDYVLIHIGFAMNKIDNDSALESLALYREIVEKLAADH